uniref:Uncharacterized protein n=1 Tax=Nelumbo nucifera TaxID=4432 RepID=A0A822YYV8_NELNU|nr:TPA_asm: hypothetical protein HUJ06_007046 [Nelumbo nucifera]
MNRMCGLHRYIKKMECSEASLKSELVAKAKEEKKKLKNRAHELKNQLTSTMRHLDKVEVRLSHTKEEVVSKFNTTENFNVISDDFDFNRCKRRISRLFLRLLKS